MHGRLVTFSLAGGLAAFASPGEAAAQPADTQADVLFRRGRELLTAGNYAEACAAFDASQELAPNISTLVNQANCREKHGQLASAWRLFADAERQTRTATDEPTRELHQIVADRATRLEPRRSMLTIEVPGDRQIAGLEILRNGERIAPDAWNQALPVDGGTYEITARAPGRPDWSTTISVGIERDRKTIEVPRLIAAAPVPVAPSPHVPPHEPAPAGHHRSILPLAFAGGAVVLLGGAAGFARWGDRTYDESKAATDEATLISRWHSDAPDAPAGLLAQRAYLKASRTGANDRFGMAVALSADGTTLAVGAPFEDTSETDSGAVYVFVRAGATWTQEAYLKASSPDADDQFGVRVALSADGSTLAVAAQFEDSAAAGVGGNQADNAATDSGAAYVFARADATWTQQAYVKASSTDADDQFGASVALSADGSTLAVGAVLEDSAATGVDGDDADNSAGNSGAVYVFARTGTGATWTPQAYVKASNTDSYDQFGASVALSADGSTLAVGAQLESSGATGVGGSEANNSATLSGAVYVFTRGATWTQQAYVKASNTGADDQFGTSVALSPDGSTRPAMRRRTAAQPTCSRARARCGPSRPTSRHPTPTQTISSADAWRCRPTAPRSRSERSARPARPPAWTATRPTIRRQRAARSTCFSRWDTVSPDPDHAVDDRLIERTCGGVSRERQRTVPRRELPRPRAR